MNLSKSTAVDFAGASRRAELNNQSEQSWLKHQELGLAFGRHVRHDIVNAQCTLQMADMAEKMRQSVGGADLPPEFAPEQLKPKVDLAVKQIVSMSSDFVILGQAANRFAYSPSRIVTAHELLHTAILDRPGCDQTSCTGLNDTQAGASRLTILGDILTSAISAIYFQWAPWIHAHSKASAAKLSRNETGWIELVVPADDIEVISGFARKLETLESPTAAPMMIQNAQKLPTLELALWLARFVVLIHGGVIHVDVNNPDCAINVFLPVAEQ